MNILYGFSGYPEWFVDLIYKIFYGPIPCDTIPTLIDKCLVK